MATAHNPPFATDDGSGFLDRVQSETFRRLGIQVDVRRVPAARSCALVVAGVEDGCGPRIAKFGRLFPELLPIRESAITYDFVAFVRRSDGVEADWQDLSRYHVGHVRGVMILDPFTAKAASATAMPRPTDVLKMLKLGRIEIAILERWQGLQAARSLGMRDIRMLEPPLVRQPLYFYLNRRHAAIAKAAADALRALKADGTYERYEQETFGPLQILD